MRIIPSNYDRVSGLITSYWQGAAIHAAVKLGIFDQINKASMTCEELGKRISVNINVLRNLLLMMVELRLLKYKGTKFVLSTDGLVLCKDNIPSFRNSAIMWWEEHLDAWRNLAYTIRTGKPSFNKLFGIPFFDWLDKNPRSLELYQNAMAEYATIDYQGVAEIVKKYLPKTILDIGGGVGILIGMILDKLPSAMGTLLERTSVLNLARKKWKGTPIGKRLKLLSDDMFQASLGKFDAIVMARVLHDWNDESALRLLSKAKSWLNPTGHLFIIERASKGKETRTPLLDLDLAIMVGGRERTLKSWQKLIKQVTLKILVIHQLRSGVSVIICQA